MSYVPLRLEGPDNQDLVGLPADTQQRLEPLADLIQDSYAAAYHRSECNCAKPTCWTREHTGFVGIEEALAWLVAKRLLNLDDVDHAIRVSKGWSVGKAPGNLGPDVTAVARLVLTERHAGASFVMRKLRIGFKRAEDCLDVLASWNIVGPAHGSAARAILVDTTKTDEVLSALKAVGA